MKEDLYDSEVNLRWQWTVKMGIQMIKNYQGYLNDKEL